MLWYRPLAENEANVNWLEQNQNHEPRLGDPGAAAGAGFPWSGSITDHTKSRYRGLSTKGNLLGTMLQAAFPARHRSHHHAAWECCLGAMGGTQVPSMCFQSIYVHAGCCFLAILEVSVCLHVYQFPHLKHGCSGAPLPWQTPVQPSDGESI